MVRGWSIRQQELPCGTNATTRHQHGEPAVFDAGSQMEHCLEGIRASAMYPLFSCVLFTVWENEPIIFIGELRLHTNDGRKRLLIKHSSLERPVQTS